MNRWITASILSLLAVPLAAQQPAPVPVPGAPTSNAVRVFLAQFARNIVAAADDMPVQQYKFRPTAPQMSVADVVMHLAGSNEFLCSSASSTPAPQEPALGPVADSVPPDQLKARLKRSFEYCQSALGKVDDSRLNDSVPWFGNRKVPRAQVLVALPYDWADHYSQMAIYLRLNGISPPNAQKRAEPVKR